MFHHPPPAQSYHYPPQGYPPQSYGHPPPPPPPQVYMPPPPPLDPNQFRREFSSRLETLTMNSRPIIQSLTMFAHDNARYADIVAQILHAHIRRSPPWMKLPAFYLLDMISKNITEPYARHFAPFLTQLFLETYALVDDSTKSKMQELLFTWRHAGPGQSELFPGGIQNGIENGLWRPTGGTSGGISATQVISELEFTLAQKERQLAMNPYDPTTKHQIGVLGQLRRLVENGVSQNELSDILSQLHSQMKSSAPAPVPQPVLPPPPPPPAVVPNVNELLSTLMKAGLVKPTTTGENKENQKPNNYADSVLSIPITLSTSGITKSNPRSHIQSFLYSSPQCKQCGSRFANGLDDHLDMHFRQNRKAKEKENTRGFNRSWFVSLDDWLGRKAKESIKAKAEEDKKGKERELRKLYVIVPPGDETTVVTCPICKEDLKTEFLEDEEEWVWSNAIKKDNRVYHATCHSEASASSTLQSRLRSSLPKSRSATPEVSLKRKAGDDSHSETGTPPIKKIAVADQ